MTVQKKPPRARSEMIGKDIAEMARLLGRCQFEFADAARALENRFGVESHVSINLRNMEKEIQNYFDHGVVPWDKAIEASDD